ncbi:hypothetical protein [Mucilaginibacter kameinonensis]|uniref:hypothetical protein n=1 Tax=Mucilaginibacter kameinonensis TaxID=452286 RepID=UPI0013CEF5D2|nr:hypothetical protein [Mucilaginibacter kameinonensis]
MKNARSKKLKKKISTICDYNNTGLPGNGGDTTSGTDTTATLTIITTTINTGLIPKR